MSEPEKIFDGLLVLQFQNGNKKAISLLVKRWHNKLCRQAFFYTKDIDLAKDIVQDSWNVILKKLYDLREPNSFGNWALTIVNRKAIDWIRKNKRKEDYINQYNKGYETINKTIDNDNNKKSINEAIKTLSENQQIILTLFYVDDYSIAEISNILNISKGTVKSRLFYAREKLKTILKSRNHEK